MRRYDESEPGAAAVQAVCHPSRRNDLFVARLVTVEVASAISRKAREGRLDARARNRTWRMFDGHVRREYRVIEISEVIYAEAERLVFAHTLRALDAIHISCALTVANEISGAALQFWTADRRQAAAAAAEGLEVQLLQ